MSSPAPLVKDLREAFLDWDALGDPDPETLDPIITAILVRYLEDLIDQIPEKILRDMYQKGAFVPRAS